MSAKSSENCASLYGCTGPGGGPCVKAANTKNQADQLGQSGFVHNLTKAQFEEFITRMETQLPTCANPEVLKKAIEQAKQKAKAHFG